MTEAQEIARRKKNLLNKSGHSKVLVHYGDGTENRARRCGSFSMYGLTTSMDESKVTCITCIRVRKNK